GTEEIIYGEDDAERAVLAIERDEVRFYVFPNPYLENTTVNYELKAESQITLEVYTMTGQKVHTIWSGPQVNGRYRFDFSAKRLGYGAGTYVLRININNDIQSYWLIEMN
ncbi:MAG: T9SS type A sorting domain-containing protein, partial [Bacteroidetes bacterium]|nr:T9SS type A sorting domain-containing protein [Bacteroidota bacterium]